MSNDGVVGSSRRSWLGAILGIGIAAAAIWAFVEYRSTWPRGEALSVALRPLIDDKAQSDGSLVARAILDNYRETRSNASRWSGIYWGFTFLAAALSALAALILKVESFNNDKLKKDVAALFSVAAALLVTISTSGDFQRKWQANRVAAAELEREGYELLEEGAVEPRTHLADVGQILLRRHLAIVGGTEEREPKGESPEDAKSKGKGSPPEDEKAAQKERP